MTSCPEHPDLTFDPVSTPAEGIALAAIHDHLHHGTATAGPAVPATRWEYDMNDQTEVPAELVEARRAGAAEVERDWTDPNWRSYVNFDALVAQRQTESSEQDPTVAASTSAEITDTEENKHTPVVVPEGTHLPEWDHEVEALDHEDALVENAYRNAHGGDEPPTSWSPHSGETVPFEVDQDDLYALLSLDQDDVARFFFEAAPEDARAGEVEHDAHLSDPNPSGQAALDYDPERDAVPEVVPSHRDYVEMYGGGMTGDIDELRAEADALDAAERGDFAEDLKVAHAEALVIDQLANEGLPTDDRAVAYAAPTENGQDFHDRSPDAHAEDLAVAEAIVDALIAEDRLDRAVVAATTPQQVDLTVYDHQPEPVHATGHAHTA